MSILIFILILLVLVLVHEFGHFFSAKKFGIRVDEFGFGFPPKLFGKKIGETEYTVNLLPIGGFVKIFGEDPNEENTNGPDASRSFIHKAKWKQAIVLFAGVFANFLLAWLLFSVGFMSGMPTSVDAQAKGYTISDVHLVVVGVAENSPAMQAGLKSGDKIVSVMHTHEDGEMHMVENLNPESLKEFVVEHLPGEEINVGYIRGKNPEVNTAEVFIGGTKNDPSIGISMDEIGTAKLPVLRAFTEGLNLTLSVTKGTAIGLYTLIHDGIMGKGSFAAVTGPVGIVGIVGDAYQFGIVYLLSFAALISINLAIINLIPFPALDGGRLFFLLIEKIKGSPINPKVANAANMIGFGILILLMIVVTYHDIIKLL
ncbi:MAG TPA: RIP metalloprotease RseP [Candidatus Paceibacterota bacterium]|jgi:regulator of sigma E protease|nr:RIP metalloprotease RseP [Candidatus Paceibacterota bacterium]